jgi:hypothetical protein
VIFVEPASKNNISVCNHLKVFPLLNSDSSKSRINQAISKFMSC